MQKPIGYVTHDDLRRSVEPLQLDYLQRGGIVSRYDEHGQLVEQVAFVFGEPLLLAA